MARNNIRVKRGGGQLYNPNVLMKEEEIREIVEQVSGVSFAVIGSPVENKDLTDMAYFARLVYLILLRKYCGFTHKEAGACIGRSAEFAAYSMKRGITMMNYGYSQHNPILRELSDECTIQARLRRGRYRDVEIVTGNADKITTKRLEEAVRREQQDADKRTTYTKRKKKFDDDNDTEEDTLDQHDNNTASA